MVAVGTTVTRALESAAGADGAGARAAPAGPTWCSGRTARRGSSTGWSPAGTHPVRRTWLLEAVAGAELVGGAYDAALRERYRWHEFGDSCLLLP